MVRRVRTEHMEVPWLASVGSKVLVKGFGDGFLVPVGKVVGRALDHYAEALPGWEKRLHDTRNIVLDPLKLWSLRSVYHVLELGKALQLDSGALTWQ